MHFPHYAVREVWVINVECYLPALAPNSVFVYTATFLHLNVCVLRAEYMCLNYAHMCIGGAQSKPCTYLGGPSNADLL